MCRCDLLKNTSGNVRLLLSSYLLLLLVILWTTLDTQHTGTYTPRGIRRSQVDGPYGREAPIHVHFHHLVVVVQHPPPGAPAEGRVGAFGGAALVGEGAHGLQLLAREDRGVQVLANVPAGPGGRRAVAVAVAIR